MPGLTRERSYGSRTELQAAERRAIVRASVNFEKGLEEPRLLSCPYGDIADRARKICPVRHQPRHWNSTVTDGGDDPPKILGCGVAAAQERHFLAMENR